MISPPPHQTHLISFAVSSSQRSDSVEFRLSDAGHQLHAVDQKFNDFILVTLLLQIVLHLSAVRVGVTVGRCGDGLQTVESA